MIPTFELPHRLRRAREVAGLDQIPFAEKIGVSRATITNYENGHVAPRRIVINAWSLATGVPVEWLLHGIVPEHEREAAAMKVASGDGARPEGFEPPTFWLVANAGDPVSVTSEPISPANVDNRPIADVIPLAGRRAKTRAA